MEYFLSLGAGVFVPVVDTERFDLIAVIDGKPQRIEVKFTARRCNKASFRVDMRRIVTGKDFDYLFVYTADNNRYCIPVSNIVNQRIVIVADKFMVR